MGTDLCVLCKHFREWPDCETEHTHHGLNSDSEATVDVIACPGFEHEEVGGR